MNKSEHLWITDPHLKPWTRRKLLNLILDDKPKGVFLTGDISYGPTLLTDLEYLGKKVNCPIYFVLGNHDYHFSSIEKVHNGVRQLCKQYKNLVWITEAGIVPLTDEVCVIGTEGWYDVLIGDSKYIKYTIDWFLTKDFKILPNMNDRFEAFRKLAKESADKIVPLLIKAMEQYKTIYLLTHFPPWPEANRDSGTIMKEFWLPYNVNLTLGISLKEVMVNYKKRNLIVLAGHTHCPVQIHVSRNIECRVGKAGYFSKIDDQKFFI